jgi:hypothetical protein
MSLNDDFLKEKISIVRKESPLKRPLNKRKRTEPKSGKGPKKEKHLMF